MARTKRMPPRDPTTGRLLSEPLEVRFERYVTRSEGCWEWTGAKNSWGYGTILGGRRMLRAARVAWELIHGPIPQGMVAMHGCDNPGCVRVAPEHVHIGTPKDNTREMHERGRFRGGSRPGDVRWIPVGERNPRAKLTTALVAEMRRLYAAGGETHRTLAQRYGIDRGHVAKVLSGKSWGALAALDEVPKP